jgi:hypothetical protein
MIISQHGLSLILPFKIIAAILCHFACHRRLIAHGGRYDEKQVRQHAELHATLR